MSGKLITIHNRDLNNYDYGPRKSRGTVMIEQPDPEVLLNALSSQFSSLSINTVPVNIGALFLHPTDQLNKKLGRIKAAERMRVIDCTIEMHPYQNMSDALWLVLQGVDDTLSVHYTITVKIYRADRKLRVMGVGTCEWKEMPVI